jgi:hypothetical protein
MNTITSDSPLFGRGESVESPKPFVLDETKTQTRFLPRPVTLTLPGHVTRKFPAGVQEIPEQLLNDPWLKANGMKEYEKGAPLPLQPQAPIGSHGYATAYAASGVYDATQVPDTRYSDEDIQNAEAVARNAAENARVARENLENADRIHQNAMQSLESARARRQQQDEELNQADPGLTGGSSQVTGAQRRALDKTSGKSNGNNRPALSDEERRKNEAAIGIDKLSPEDRAKFDKMSDKQKADYVRANPEERAVLLASVNSK